MLQMQNVQNIWVETTRSEIINVGHKLEASFINTFRFISRPTVPIVNFWYSSNPLKHGRHYRGAAVSLNMTASDVAHTVCLYIAGGFIANSNFVSKQH
jgi:hypothetical protein